MYSFIFYMFYRVTRKPGPNPRVVGAGQVAMTQVFHVFCLGSIVRYLTGFTLPRFNQDYTYNKLSAFLFFFTWGYIVYRYYNEDRIKSILASWEEKLIGYSLFRKWLFVVLIMGIPLITGIILLSNLTPANL